VVPGSGELVAAVYVDPDHAPERGRRAGELLRELDQADHEELRPDRREYREHLVARLAGDAGIAPSAIDGYVLHAGGKRILEAVEAALGVGRDATMPSWEVLRDFGNQSSASVIFVLDAWLKRRRPPAGTYAALAAFGPGLTVEAVLLRWQSA